MNVVITNSKITINNIDASYLEELRKHLSYRDKSKEYQVRRLQRSKYYRNGAYVKKLSAEIDMSILDENSDGSVAMSSGFYKLIPDDAAVIDNRRDTGDEISLPWREKPKEPRPYQKECIELIKSNYRGVINLATGLGKTLIGIYAIKHFRRRSLVVCPSVSIASNFYERLCRAFGKNRVGMFGGGKKQVKDITVGVIASVNNNVELFKSKGLGLVIIDECHHTPAATLYNIGRELGHVGRMFGLTATNFRNDGKDVMITASVGPTLVSHDVKWGIDNGWLAKPHFLVRRVSTVGPDVKFDKLKNYKHHVLNYKPLTDRIVEDCKAALRNGRSVLCLVKEVSHGRQIADALGAPFATSSDKMSNEYVRLLNEGKIKCLVGTDSKIGEGTDTKNVDVLVLANFVANRGQLLQNIGRGLRIKDENAPQRKVIIIDYMPMGSSMLKRHAAFRLKVYRQVTDNVTLI